MSSSLFKVSYRDIFTLNPSKFLKLGQDWIDLSGVTHPTIRVLGSTLDEKGAPEFKPVRLPYAFKQDSDNIRAPRQHWPSYSKGFLYYYSPPNRPPIAGQLRLRLTPSNRASEFSKGKDLCFLDRNSQPWKRPLYSIATTDSLRPLYDKLLEDHLVSPDLDNSLKSLPKLTFMYSRSQIIHTLHDTFTLDLSSDWISLLAVSEKGIETVQLLRQFRDLRLSMPPYSGTVLARFEPSPFPQHANTRTVVLRFLQELSPINCLVDSYDGYVERPRPGHLFSKHFYGVLRPWSLDIDIPGKGKVTSEGLKLIWGLGSGDSVVDADSPSFTTSS